MYISNRTVVLLSPILIIGIHHIVAYGSGQVIGKWAFVPMLITCWLLWMYFVLRYGGGASIQRWLQPPKRTGWWIVLALFVGILPLPVFLFHHDALASWTIWLPWLVIALINPWIEEFYWRGLLLDYTKHWPAWTAVLYSSGLFALNHFAFGINSQVNSGYDVVVATFIMGVAWAIIYLKTKSLRWTIFSHILVDLLNLSAAGFLDVYDKGSW